MGQHDADAPLFWQTGVRSIPRRPDNPETFPEQDARHWYDIEYAGWTSDKLPMPESPMDGPKGKRIAALLPPDDHPYVRDFLRGMRNAADGAGVVLRVFSSDWNPQAQERDAEGAMAWDPDLIIIWIESLQGGAELISRFYDAGIPVLAANTRPDAEGLRRVLSCSGPDDWTQFRQLARKFAELMRFQGGYAIVCHIENTPTYDARSWSVITELAEAAPDMTLLAMASTQLDEEQTYHQVRGWLQQFGNRLQGIVSADDNRTQLGINRALLEYGRSDIVRVANGSTPTGIRLVGEGELDAITFQLAEQDGALPIKLASDWFSGLAIPPMRHLPIRVLDRHNIDLLVNRRDLVMDLEAEQLYQDILDCRSEAVRDYFTKQIQMFAEVADITMEFFRGFCIEQYANLHHIIKTVGLDEVGIVGSHEAVYSRLFQQPSMERTLRWLEQVSLSIIRRLSTKRNRHRNLVSRVIAHVEQNLGTPLSLKTLSYEFDISAAYLGRLFTEETGEAFNTWLNARRIEKAIELMKSTDSTIRQIAERVGYANPNYFYKLFKKTMGINPGEFQNRLSENGQQ